MGTLNWANAATFDGNFPSNNVTEEPRVSALHLSGAPLCGNGNRIKVACRDGAAPNTSRWALRTLLPSSSASASVKAHSPAATKLNVIPAVVVVEIRR